MLIEWFLSIKSLPNLLFGVLCLPGDQGHPFAQPTINPLACCICWAGLLGRAVFPPWNEGWNFGSYILFMEFPRQEYWSGLPFSSPGDFPDQVSNLHLPVALALAAGFFTMSTPGKCISGPIQRL